MLMVNPGNLDTVRHAVVGKTIDAPDAKPTKPLFPWWHGLFVTPNRETRSAERLKRVDVHVYLPSFSKRIGRRGGNSQRRDYAVIPGMMFAPVEFLDIENREKVFKWAHVRGFLLGAGGLGRIAKAHIEIIREIEAKLNTEEEGGIPGAHGEKLAIGLRVTFLNSLYSAFFGDGVIKELVSTTRIGVEVSQLFGCPRIVYVPASEIEAM